MNPILKDRFHHDGRGPELVKAWIEDGGLYLEAIDFFNPEDPHKHEYKKHLWFDSPQAFMVTPEEEFHVAKRKIDWAEVGKAALFDLGRTQWCEEFSNRHSSRCRHYLAMFYDEYLDILCEGIEVRDGGYKSTANKAVDSIRTSSAGPLESL